MARLRHRLPAGHGDLLDLPPHRGAAPVRDRQGAGHGAGPLHGLYGPAQARPRRQPRRCATRVRQEAQAAAGLTPSLSGPTPGPVYFVISLDVAAPIPAPTSPPTNAGPTSGQPARAATARPEPAPIAPPVAARWPHVSPQADTDRASGRSNAAKIFIFIVLGP